MITLDQLITIMPHAQRPADFLSHLNAAMVEFGITTPPREQMFLATVAHESGDLNNLSENLNYSAAALCRTWPTRFPTLASAMPYNRNPTKIANRVYANRNGNGDEASGDGWRHRGVGLIQLTFKNNHVACAKHFNISPSLTPVWLRTPEGASRSAAWFWKTHGCNELADQGDFDGICDAINIGHKTAAVGDAIGYPNRLAVLSTARDALA